MVRPDLTGITEWLAHASLQGLLLDEILGHVCEALLRGGVPLQRVHLSVSTLHPSFSGFGYTWTPATGTVRETYGHDGTGSFAWRSSPFRHMVEAGLDSMRLRLDRPHDGPEFPIFAQFRRQGMTDWIALRQSFDWLAPRTPFGHLGMVTSWSTRHPAGFDDAAEAALRKVLVPLGAAAKSQIVQDISRDVLAAYIGDDAALRVLAGEITRGTVSEIPAVILLADMRGFTALSNTHPTRDVIAMLNRAFDAAAHPIMEEGGQILKFMGDAVLAVFLTAERSLAETARRAVAAAMAIQHNVPAPLAIDVAIHLGDVHYGNVGASDRLDFTVIGAAVNEASRMEGLCSLLGEPVLISAPVAALLPPGTLRSRGAHPLRGFDQPREVFAPG